MFTVMWVRIESFLVFHSLVISAFPLEIELLGGLWILLIYLTSARSCICFKPAFPMPYVKVYFVFNELRWELTFRCVVIGGFTHHHCLKGPGGSMSYVVGLPHNSYKPITNTTWVLARLCKLQKGCTQLAVASDKVYQLLAHGRWFSPGTPDFSTTKTGRHYIAESGVKHNKSNQIIICVINHLSVDNKTITVYGPIFFIFYFSKFLTSKSPSCSL